MLTAGKPAVLLRQTGFTARLSSINTFVERERERKEMVYSSVCLLPSAGKPGVKKTGFVYADAQTVQLATLNYFTLSLSHT